MLQLGRFGQVYVVAESAFATHPGHASADAVRHINFQASYDPKNKRHSPEKKQSPGRVVRFDGRETAALTALECLLRPSGTLNTLPEASEIIEAAFGSKTNTALSTTIASGAAVGGCTLTSGAGLAVGDFLSVVVSSVKYAVRLTSVAGAVVAWAPNLPSAPSVGAVVKCGITYKLTTALALSLSISHYLKKTDASAGFKRGLLGVGIDKLSLMFDANEEARFTASGPAKTQTTGSTPAAPGAFTTVGGNPPSGMTSRLVIGTATEAKFLKLQAELNNGLKVRNDESATSAATELFRVGRRDITLGLDMRLEDETLIYDQAEAGTNLAVFLQQGFTEGNILALALPQVEFKVPDTDDGDEEVNWPFKGMALESADGANDEAYLAIL